ncbi:MAG: hexitol phosphatase HxpB [Bacteroidales bacterium]|nr:hexitol phosphatase HxpB [Bacteroidales bacterium]
MTERKNIEAVILDMDGILIDSERHWQLTERAIFAELGIDLSEKLLVETRGLNTGEMMAHWSARFPLDGRDTAALMKEYDRRMVETMKKEVPLMEGARELIGMFRGQGLPLALATCSTPEHIDAVMEKHGLRDSFDHLVSAAVDMPGKPHPEVFLRTARLLKADPTRCLVFEDSFNGLVAAKAARMIVVVMPDPLEFKQERFGAADLKIGSLTEFTLDTLNKLQKKP